MRYRGIRRRLLLLSCRSFQTNIDTDDRDVTRPLKLLIVRKSTQRPVDRGGTSLFASVNSFTPPGDLVAISVASYYVITFREQIVRITLEF